jgi:hypothetical protein
MNRRSGKIILVLGGLALGLLVSEIALRLANFSYITFYIPDEERGLSLRPGAEGWWHKEGTAYVRINQDGLRDREHAKLKSAGTLRIAVLGDSYPEALQVPLEEAFWSVSERRLAACEAFGGRRIEVINFGVSGYQTAQELITLRQHVWDYQPDIVLLTVTTANDIRDNSLHLAHYPASPFGVYRDGVLVIDNSSVEKRNASFSFRLKQRAAGWGFYWLRDRSRVIQLLEKVRLNLNSSLERKDDAAGSEEVGLSDQVYREPDDPAWQEAWHVTEGLLTAMRDEVRAKGAGFFVVTLSNSIQVNPDRTIRQAFMNRLGVNDLFFPDLRIKDWGEHNRVPVLNLAPLLQAHADRTGLPLHGFKGLPAKGHWNSAGHQLAGELIARKLCEESAGLLANR